MCNLITLLYTWNTHTANQLYFDFFFFDFFKIKKNLKNKTVPRGRHALTNSFNYLLGRCALQCSFILSASRTYCNTLSNSTAWGLLSSLLFSHSVMSNTLQPHGLQHARLPCPSISPGAAQTHVHWVSDAMQPSHPLWPLSPPAFSLSQHQGLF